MPFTEDLSEFFHVHEHATAAVVGSTTVYGIFENRYIDTEGIEGTHPTFLAERAKLEAAAGSTWQHGKILLIAGTLYLVRSVQPDETGNAVLSILEKN